MQIYTGVKLMSRGDKSAYTDKQKRQARHIIESEKERGHSEEEAERIGWSFGFHIYCSEKILRDNPQRVAQVPW